MSASNVIDGQWFGKLAAQFPETAWSCGSTARAPDMDRPAMSPVDWLARGDANPTMTGVCIRLRQQIGKTFGGYDAMHHDLQAAIAALLWRLRGDRDAMERVLIAANARTSVPRDLPMSVLREWDADMATRHAHDTGVWWAVVVAAKAMPGIISNSSFLWLRETCPVEWLILSSQGRDGVFVECLGAIAHARAEFLMGRPLANGDVSLGFAARPLLDEVERITQRSTTSADE